MRGGYDKPNSQSAAMNQQPQMDEARAAVKQQLLRTLMQQAVDELAADSQEQIDQQIRDIEIDLEPARERIRTMIAAKASSVKEHATRQVRDMVDAEASAVWDGLDIDALAADSLATAQPEFHLHPDIASDITQRVKEQVQLQMEELIREQTESAMQTVDVDSAVNAAVVAKARTLSEESLSDDHGDRSEMIEQTIESVLASSDLTQTVATDVRKSLVQRIADRTLDGLGDADRLSHEARALITFDQDDLIAATTILRTRIIQDIARRTARSLGNREELATDAELWISASDPDLEAARDAAMASLTRHLETELRKELQNPASMARSAADHVAVESEEHVSNAVMAARELLIANIASLTGEHLSDTEVMASRASAAIPLENNDVQRIVKATMALILGEVISEAEGRLLHVEKLSSEARTRMAESLAGVEQAADMLEGMLVAEVGAKAGERLADVQRIVDAARERMDATSGLDAAWKSLVSRLQDEIARMAEQKIDQTDEVVQAAWECVDLQSEGIARLERALQDKVLHLVATNTLEALGQVEQSVSEAMDRVPGDAPEIGLIAESLRDRIMATVLADTLRTLGQSAEKNATGEDMGLLRKAMTAVLEPEAKGVSWTSLSDMDEPEPVDVHATAGKELPEVEQPEVEQPDVEQPEVEQLGEELQSQTEYDNNPIEDEAAKPWAVSELFAPGDGAVSKAPGLATVSSPNTSTQSLIYVYGVVDIDALDPQDIKNIEGLAAGSELQFHTWENLCAVTSRVPASTFGGGALKAAMSDASWTKGQVSRHAEILNALPCVESLVPLPFGEVFESPVDLDDFLSERHEAFRDALSRLSNRKEFSVRLHVDMHALREHFMASDARIDASLNDMTRGVAGFIREELKLSAEAPDEAQLATLIQNVVGNTHTRILGVASEGLLKNVPGSPDSTHRIVLNASYLVSEAKEAEFRATVNTIAAQYAQMGVEFQLSGPWMAYHFTHIEPSNAYAV